MKSVILDKQGSKFYVIYETEFKDLNWDSLNSGNEFSQFLRTQVEYINICYMTRFDE